MGRRFVLGLFLATTCLATACGGSDVDDGAEPPPADVDAAPPAPPPPTTDAGPPPSSDSGPSCAPLTFPSGVTFKTKPDDALTAQYKSIALEPNYPLPVCFIDTDDLVDPNTGKSYDLDVALGKYFTLRELVGTELKYGKRVLLSPTLVAKLDRYHDALNASVNITSGYRSPAHQREVCQEMCGQDYCPGTCAQRSRHSWGDAADHGVYPTKKYSDAGCAADFNYVYREGNHVHLDLNPEHAICTVDVL